MSFVVVLIIINFLFFSAVSYYLYKERRLLREEKRLSLDQTKHEEEVLEKEIEQYQKDFEETKEKAQYILSESEKLAQELVMELQKVLGKEAKDTSSILPAEHLEQNIGYLKEKIKKQYAYRISHLLKNLEKVTYHEAKKVEDYAEELEKRTDTNIQKVRLEELERTHKKIEDYKNAEIELFNEKVKKVVNEAAFDILGHSLTQLEQEELVMRAIHKAREDNVL